MPRRTRRTLRLAPLVVLLAAACGDPQGAEPGTAAQGGGRAARSGPPNVVLIVLDTARGDRCGFNGYELPTTPHLDRLGAEGTVFRDCWSPSPWTGPSHASLFTGLRPPHHGFMQERRHLLREDTVLAEILLDAGYRTCAVSSNAFVSPGFGLTQGFEEFEAVYADPDRSYPSAILAHERAVAWVEEVLPGDAPFFLFVNDIEPHAPYSPPMEHLRRFAPEESEDELALAMRFENPSTIGYSVGAVAVEPATLATVSRLYDAEISTVDEQVGLLVERLRELGALENTVVIVCGDHGENLGDHGLAEHMFSVHRTLLHVPLLVWAPGRVPAGRVLTDPVRLEDVFPTILELCGQPVPPGLDGESLLGDVTGRIARAAYGRPTAGLDIANRLFPGARETAARLDRSLRSVYDGRHHLIRASDGHEELYDVAADPLETDDLSADENAAGVLERLRPLLDP